MARYLNLQGWFDNFKKKGDLCGLNEVSMKRYYSLFFFFFLWGVMTVQAQEEEVRSPVNQALDSIVMMHGQLRDTKDGKPIPYAHVLNLRFGKATVSDTLGFFTIPMRRKDTVLITAIGYEDLYFTLPPFWPANTYSGVLYVEEKVYNIEGVTVHGLGTYEQFKQKVLALDLSDDKTVKMQSYYNKILTEEAIKYQAVTTGFSFSLRSPEEKSLRKLQKVLAEQKIEDQIKAKYNKAIVSRLTGLKGKQLEDFMQYCQIPRDFILKSPEYDILARIKDAYENYKLLDQKKK